MESGDGVREAVVRARMEEHPLAEEALRDLEVNGWRSGFAETVACRLAGRLADDLRPDARVLRGCALPDLDLDSHLAFPATDCVRNETIDLVFEVRVESLEHDPSADRTDVNRPVIFKARHR
jgi:hypothetical protein